MSLPQILFDESLLPGAACGGILASAHAPGKANAPAALESMPHVSEQVQKMWATRGLDTFIHNLLIDSRSGQRQGFPVEVAAELLFVAKINLMVRAMASASLLQVSVAQACAMIAEGDRLALGLADSSCDPWNDAPGRPEKTGGETTADLRPGLAANSESRSAPAINRPAPLVIAPPSARTPAGRGAERPDSTQNWLSVFLSEMPPLPATVRLDLTAPEPECDARHGGHDAIDMSWDLFRCLTREIRGLGTEELVLSNLGNGASCGWLPEAILFAKRTCQFSQVVLRADLLAANQQQLDGAMVAGLNGLVINLNLSSAKWRRRANKALLANPDFFVSRIQGIVRKRDEHFSRTRQHCVISVSRVGGDDGGDAANEMVAQLAGMADLESFEWRDESPGPADAGVGRCLCWAPFTEASVRANGHLVVCPHDYSGSSSVADLKGTEFAQAWHSDGFQRTRRGVLRGEIEATLCAHCVVAAARRPQPVVTGAC